MKKILITGSHGQMGRALNDFYGGNEAVRLINTDVDELNITDKQEVKEKIREIAPDIIINCAATHRWMPARRMRSGLIRSMRPALSFESCRQRGGCGPGPHLFRLCV